MPPQRPLLCHRNDVPAGFAVTAWAHVGDQKLTISYALVGDLRGLRIPSRRAQGRADELWRHTCFEAFVADADAPVYDEFNFSPANAWAHYRFHHYRHRDALHAAMHAPTMEWTQADGHVSLSVQLPLLALPAARNGLQIGLAAVLEHDDGALSHWALQHSTERPDFHVRDSFAVHLPFTT